MMSDRRTRSVWFLCWCAWLLLLPGCPPPADEGTERDSSSTSASDEAPPEPLLEDFDAPSLEELDAKVTWIDQPILDGMELYRKHKAEQPPLASVEAALNLRNTGPEENAKILSALGQPWESESDVDYDATLNRHAYGDLKTTNPVLISSTTSFDVQGYSGVTLIGFDWNFNTYGLADYVTSWQVSEDRLYDKLVLRDDLTWSDGKPLTAYDVMFSFQTILDSRIPIPAVRSGTDQIRWVEAYDDRTVVFFHKKALATNVWNILYPLIPKHIYENSIDDDTTLENSDYHRKYEDNPVCGGPYVISKRVKGQEIVLERREDWYMHDGTQVRAKPHFKTIRFQIIEDSNTALLSIMNGEIDEMELEASHWNTQTSGDDFYKYNTKASAVQWVSFHFGWNCEDPIFKDPRVRKAMSYAFDYKEMLDNLCYGVYEPSMGIYHHSAWMAPDPMPTPYKQDLDKAEELLAEAGWTDSDGDGILDKEINGRRQPFEFTIVTSNRELRIAICTLLKECLDQIGIICNVKPLEFTVLEQVTHEKKFQAWMGGWGTGTDPDTSENLWATGKNRNYVQYANPKVDALFEAGKREFDREKRAAIYAEIHNRLWEDQPYTWLYFRTAFYGFNKKLRGYMFSARGPYHYDPGAMAIYAVP